jgi:hypothetical protein
VVEAAVAVVGLSVETVLDAVYSCLQSMEVKIHQQRELGYPVEYAKIGSNLVISGDDPVHSLVESHPLVVQTSPSASLAILFAHAVGFVVRKPAGQDRSWILEGW